MLVYNGARCVHIGELYAVFFFFFFFFFLCVLSLMSAVGPEMTGGG